jgi:hypothetical protein
MRRLDAPVAEQCRLFPLEIVVTATPGDAEAAMKCKAFDKGGLARTILATNQGDRLGKAEVEALANEGNVERIVSSRRWRERFRKGACMVTDLLCHMSAPPATIGDVQAEPVSSSRGVALVQFNTGTGTACTSCSH